jgi:hypothetical protein
MIKRLATYLSIALLTVGTSCGSASAEDQHSADLSSQWDSAVSSLLLAAGMYGLDVKNDEAPGPGFSASPNLLKTLPSDFASLDTNNITLSYSGSSGRLGFSAGYLYTSLRDNQQPETLLVGLDSPDHPLHLNSPEKDSSSWYLTLDYSKAFQLNNSFSLGFGTQAMLMKNPFDTQDGRILSMLLNLPMSYKKYFTLTPELQWSRTIPDATAVRYQYSKSEKEDNKDVFYGGMSISFSY